MWLSRISMPRFAHQSKQFAAVVRAPRSAASAEHVAYTQARAHGGSQGIEAPLDVRPVGGETRPTRQPGKPVHDVLGPRWYRAWIPARIVERRPHGQAGRPWGPAGQQEMQACADDGHGRFRGVVAQVLCQLFQRRHFETARSWLESKRPQQMIYWDTQRLGQTFDVVDGHVASAALDMCDESAVQPSFKPKEFLGPTPYMAKILHPACEGETCAHNALMTLEGGDVR